MIVRAGVLNLPNIKKNNTYGAFSLALSGDIATPIASASLAIYNSSGTEYTYSSGGKITISGGDTLEFAKLTESETNALNAGSYRLDLELEDDNGDTFTYLSGNVKIVENNVNR